MKYKKYIQIWLLSGILLISLMVTIGGITRLTNSGLSMVTWEPISGIVPPLNQAQWEKEFDQYKQYPEYQKINKGMTLNEFKEIFFWEYFHRVLGRVIGLVFVIPFIFFYVKKSFSPDTLKRLGIIFLMGGAQGFIGWYMVKSGLVDRPDVSHYRLTLHLLMAFTLVAYIFWTYSFVKNDEPVFSQGHSLLPLSYIIFIIVLIQIVYGAFTAGLDAAYGYNTFPLMGGNILPNGYNMLDPFYKNLVENRFMVQFIHRTVGWILLSIAVVWYFKSRDFYANDRIKFASMVFLGTVFTQFVLGVLTLLLTKANIPIHLAVTHQLGALVLLVSVVHINFVLRTVTVD